MPCFDCLLAEGAGGRIRVKLLNGAREELQALFYTSALGAAGNCTLGASRACTRRASYRGARAGLIQVRHGRVKVVSDDVPVCRPDPGPNRDRTSQEPVERDIYPLWRRP